MVKFSKSIRNEGKIVSLGNVITFKWKDLLTYAEPFVRSFVLFVHIEWIKEAHRCHCKCQRKIPWKIQFCLHYFYRVYFHLLMRNIFQSTWMWRMKNAHEQMWRCCWKRNLDISNAFIRIKSCRRKKKWAMAFTTSKS